MFATVLPTLALVGGRKSSSDLHACPLACGNVWLIGNAISTSGNVTETRMTF